MRWIYSGKLISFDSRVANRCNSLHMLLIVNVLALGSEAVGFVRAVVTVIRPTG